MSSLTTEVKEVWVVRLHISGGGFCDVAEYAYDCLEGARERASEDLSDYIARTGRDAYCTLEHVFMPVYK